MPDAIINPDLTPIGLYNFRNQRKKFGIKVDDRRRHIYVVGKTGTGKTTLLRNMMIADIQSGKGVAVLDPHGEFADSLLDYVPEERVNDVIYFDPSDMANPIAFNPMEQVNPEFRHLVASGIMSVFKKIWVDAWSARMEYILNNTLLALLEFPDTTLLGVMRMFSDKEFRKRIVENLQDPVIKAFWRDEFANYGQRLEAEALAAIQNKVGQLVSNPLLRNILGQPRSTLNMREIMDQGKILVVNLSKGKLGEDNSALLGAMIITRFQLAAMSRVDMPERDRRDFFLYVDEFQNFATDSFANILSEARKYGLSLVLAHQYIGQLEAGDNTRVRDAIFGNVGTIICFRVGASDAEFLEKEFMPQFLQNDLVNLDFACVYIRLMIDGMASQPFSANTLPPMQPLLVSHRDVIISNSRSRYSLPRAVVEKRIAGEWQAESASSVGEKIVRRTEMRLNDVLRPDASVQRISPREAIAAADKPAGVMPAPIPPRESSSPAPIFSTPLRAPVASPRPSPVVGAAPVRPVATRPLSPAFASPSPAVRPAAPAHPSPAISPAPLPAVRQSEQRPTPTRTLNKDEVLLEEFVKSRAPEKIEKHKQFPKPSVDIDALRKSISMSMVKKNQSREAEAGSIGNAQSHSSSLPVDVHPTQGVAIGGEPDKSDAEEGWQPLRPRGLSDRQENSGGPAGRHIDGSRSVAEDAVSPVSRPVGPGSSFGSKDSKGSSEQHARGMGNFVSRPAVSPAKPTGTTLPMEEPSAGDSSRTSISELRHDSAKEDHAS